MRETPTVVEARGDDDLRACAHHVSRVACAACVLRAAGVGAGNEGSGCGVSVSVVPRLAHNTLHGMVGAGRAALFLHAWQGPPRLFQTYRTDTGISTGALTAKHTIQNTPYPRNLAANAWQRGRADAGRGASRNQHRAPRARAASATIRGFAEGHQRERTARVCGGHGARGAAHVGRRTGPTRSRTHAWRAPLPCWAATCPAPLSCRHQSRFSARARASARCRRLRKILRGTGERR